MGKVFALAGLAAAPGGEALAEVAVDLAVGKRLEAGKQMKLDNFFAAEEQRIRQAVITAKQQTAGLDGSFAGQRQRTLREVETI